jgi:putative transcriptional regulator
MESLKPACGRFLISDPSLQDFYFRKSVVILAEHNKEGSFGLIVNKPVSVQLSEIVKDFPPFDSAVYLGGPIKTDSLFYIHTCGDVVKDSMKILDGLYWGGDIDQIQDLILKGSLLPDQIRFFIGYSGWSSGQLDQELELKSWVVSQAHKKHVLTNKPDKLWNNLLLAMGGEYKLWANFPADVTMN